MTCAAGSRRRAGRARSSSRTGRRGSSSRPSRRSPSSGRPSTTGARAEAKLNALPQFTTGDRRAGGPLHPCPIAARGRAALGHDPRVAGLGRSSSSRPSGRSPTRPRTAAAPRTRSTSCCRPSPATASPTEPAELGWGPIRIGRAWDVLMHRLGYSRYVAQGGDVGSQVTDAMGRLGLDGLLGIHTNLLTPALGDPVALSSSPPTPEEQAALDQLDAFHATGTGYFIEQATRPRDDRLRPAGFARRARGLDDRSRHGRLREDRPRLRRRASRRAI